MARGNIILCPNNLDMGMTSNGKIILDDGVRPEVKIDGIPISQWKQSQQMENCFIETRKRIIVKREVWDSEEEYHDELVSESETEIYLLPGENLPGALGNDIPYYVRPGTYVPNQGEDNHLSSNLIKFDNFSFDGICGKYEPGLFIMGDGVGDLTMAGFTDLTVISASFRAYLEPVVDYWCNLCFEERDQETEISTFTCYVSHVVWPFNFTKSSMGFDLDVSGKNFWYYDHPTYGDGTYNNTFAMSVTNRGGGSWYLHPKHSGNISLIRRHGQELFDPTYSGNPGNEAIIIPYWQSGQANIPDGHGGSIITVIPSARNWYRWFSDDSYGFLYGSYRFPGITYGF